MKHTPFALLLAGLFWSAAPNAVAQISSDDASSNFLALHCAVSGGRNAADYADYGRDLAKTVGVLTPSQQKRVFGFLPRPNTAASIPDYNPDFHGTLGTASAGSNESGGPNGTGAGAGGDAGEPDNAETNSTEGATASGSSNNPLVDAISNFNDALNGTDSDSNAIIGGTPPSDSGGTESETKKESGSNWWDGILDWLNDVREEAVESGVIDSEGNVNRDENGNVVDSEGNVVFRGSSKSKG